MFVKATDLNHAPLPQVDLCIIGAGPAGLSMLHRLAPSHLRIALLESGPRTGVADGQNSHLNAGVSDLVDYPFETSRARGFGGTSALWTGACLTLDPDDFEERDWLRHSGWPITANDLAPFYEAAGEIYGMVDERPYLKMLEPTPLHGNGFAARFAQLAKQTELGPKFDQMIAASDNVTCVTGATVVGLHTTESGLEVSGVDVRDTSGKPHTIRASAYVLAAGGIETPRILLNAPSPLRAAMNRSADVIGRYHMEHPIRSLGVIKVPCAQKSITGFTNFTSTENVDLQGIFGLDRETRQKEQLLNLHFRTYRFHPLENDPAIIRLKEIAMGNQPKIRGLWGHATPRTIAKWAHYGSWHLWNQRSRTARFDHVRLLAFLEQEPDPDNRITLSTENDRFGTPLPSLSFCESDWMKASVDRTLTVVASRLKARGIDHVELGEADHLKHYGGYGFHHMGGTRMSSDPTQGVVDAECKVHGISNLFIASSSVFPTGGAANPTLTISALALRLADHLVSSLA